MNSRSTDCFGEAIHDFVTGQHLSFAASDLGLASLRLVEGQAENLLFRGLIEAHE